MSQKKAIFLDRDGTIIIDQHYPRFADKVSLLPKAADAMKIMKDKGYLIFVVSNQSGIARGIISDEQFKDVHKKTCELLQKEGVEIEEFAYCFHHPEDACRCRKPKPGLVPKRYQEHELDLKGSFVVGDRKSDLELARQIGAKGCLVLTGKGKETTSELNEEDPFEIYEDLFAVAEKLPSTDA